MLAAITMKGEEDMELLHMERDVPFIPREVVELVIRQDMPLVKINAAGGLALHPAPAGRSAY